MIVRSSASGHRRFARVSANMWTDQAKKCGRHLVFALPARSKPSLAFDIPRRGVVAYIPL